MSTTIEITCAKPGCHWEGPPADAPGHLCPTPAPDAFPATVTEEQLGNPFAGMIDIHGDAIPDEDEPAGEDDEAVDGADVDEDGDEIAYDADPTDRDGLEAWLSAHGSYDDEGVPQDERTATLDARYSTFADADPEPPLDELDDITALDPAPPDEPPAEEAVGEPGAADAAASTEPQPWQTVIAEALQQQTSVKEYRWLVVWHPDDGRDASLIGRGKIKNEAVIIQEDIVARGTLTGPVEVHKTVDVLAQAAEIEKRRELVEEPARVVEQDPEPVDDQDEDQPEIVQPRPAADPGDSTTATVTDPVRNQSDEPAAPAKPPRKPALFDASDYDREDLALPKVDGHPIDRISVAFNGEIMLDRSNPDHVQLWRRLLIGKEVELWVTAKGKGVASTGATNREGDLDVIVGKRTVAITTVRILGPEDLEDAAREIAAQARDAAENEDARERAHDVDA